jgi:hypothetical protein
MDHGGLIIKQAQNSFRKPCPEKMGNSASSLFVELLTIFTARTMDPGD